VTPFKTPNRNIDVRFLRLVSLGSVALAVLVCPAITGCAAINAVKAAENTPVCTETPFISPTAVTLDRNSTSNNSQQFTSGLTVPAGCTTINYPAIDWTVSNTVAATITSTGVASCKATATGIVVSSGSAGVPTATLTCM
jgi:hypothetical protein